MHLSRLASPQPAAPRKAKGAETTPAEAVESELHLASRTLRVAKELDELTGLESSVTLRGHLESGGTPSAGCVPLSEHRVPLGVRRGWRGAGEAERGAVDCHRRGRAAIEFVPARSRPRCPVASVGRTLRIEPRA